MVSQDLVGTALVAADGAVSGSTRRPRRLQSAPKRGVPRAMRLACLTAPFVIAAACESSAPQVMNLSSYSEPVEGLGGYDHFDQICGAPVVVRVGSDSPVLASISSVDFDSSLGVLVADPLENRAFLFAWDGQLHSSFGRAGRGPGEFAGLTDAVFLADGEIGLLDRSRGVSRFGIEGQVHAPPSQVVLGGTSLSVADTTSLLVAITTPSNGHETAALWRAIQLRVRGGRQLRLLAPESPQDALGFRNIRKSVVAVSSDGVMVAVGNLYDFQVDFYDLDGYRLLGTWIPDLDHLGFRQMGPRSRWLRSAGAFVSWVTSGSHLLSLGFLSDGTLLASWDRFVDASRRRLFLTRYRVDGDSIVFSEEIPYRLMRTHGMKAAFLDTRTAPYYSVLVCEWQSID